MFDKIRRICSFFRDIVFPRVVGANDNGPVIGFGIPASAFLNSVSRSAKHHDLFVAAYSEYVIEECDTLETTLSAIAELEDAVAFISGADTSFSARTTAITAMIRAAAVASAHETEDEDGRRLPADAAWSLVVMKSLPAEHSFNMAELTPAMAMLTSLKMLTCNDVGFSSFAGGMLAIAGMIAGPGLRS